MTLRTHRRVAGILFLATGSICQMAGGENKMNGKQNEPPSEAEMAESNEVGWARQVAQKEQLSLEQLTPKALENLNRNAGFRRAGLERASKLKLEPVEETLLIFDPENIKTVGDGFNDKNDILFLYEVVDPETSGIDVKISRRQVFPANKDTSEIIDSHLREGNNILRIQKIGSGEESQYRVTPV